MWYVCHGYVWVCHIFLEFKVSRYIKVYSFWSIWVWNFRRLGPKLKLSWLYLTGCLSLAGNFSFRTTPILVRSFRNFKFKILKYSRNCSLQYTLIPNFWQPLMYMYAYSLFFNCMSLLDPVRLLFITVRHWVIWKLTNS